MEKSVGVYKGSSNVFKDLGCDNPNEKLLKAKLVHSIDSVITTQGLTLTQVAQVLNVDVIKVSDLLKGKTEGFSIESLISLLDSLGYMVDVVLSKHSELE